MIIIIIVNFICIAPFIQNADQSASRKKYFKKKKNIKSIKQEHMHRKKGGKWKEKREILHYIQMRLLFLSDVELHTGGTMTFETSSSSNWCVSVFCLCRPAMQQQLKPEQLIYDNRLLSYSARLTSAVNTVLTHIGFLQNQNESSWYYLCPV